MQKRISKIISGILSGVMAVSLMIGNMAMPVFAESYTDNDGVIFKYEKYDDSKDYPDNPLTGYAIQTITANTDAVTVPDVISENDAEIPVVALGGDGEYTPFETNWTVLGYNSNVTELSLGENVRFISNYAFLGANSLATISGNEFFHVSGDSLFIPDGTIVKYFGNDANYKVPDTLENVKINEVYCIDHKNFDTLDLTNVSVMYRKSLLDDTIGTLILPINEISEGTNGQDKLFYGVHISEFQVPEGSAYSTSANRKVLLCNNEIVKFADSLTSLDSNDIPAAITSISPYAFNSVEQYFALEDAIDDSIMRNVVFSFREQDEAVMIVNGQVGFCYNSDAKVPVNVTGNPSDYDKSIDNAHSDEIIALMRIGVPYDMLGIFEDCFEMTYEEYQNLPDTVSEGDAALNAMAALIYEIVDGEGTAEKWLQEGMHGNMHNEAVEYAYALWRKLENGGYQDYVYELEIDSAINPLNFTRSGNDYISGDFKIDIYAQSDTDHENPIEGYMCTVDILTPEGQEEPSVIVNETGLTTFKTGETVHLKYTGNIDNIAEDLQNITFAYEEPKLSYYQTGSSYQDILVFGTTNNTLLLSIRVTVNSIQISKVDITTGEELPGAHLEITTEDGETVDEWVSTDTPHEVTLDDGKYVLTETTAPDGYETAESITFEIVDGMVADSDDNTVVMEDKPLDIKVKISKVDMTTGEELPGAHLEITTEDGDTVDEWISTDTPHEVTLDDGKYILTETTAPDGYETAESITFEIVDGMVAGSDDNTVVMEDRPVTTTVPGEATPDNATPDDAKPGTTPKYGELFIAKTVTNGGSTTKEFDFVLTLSDETINGEYGDVTFVNGVAEFTLTHGEYVDITGLPEDIQYTVEEEEYSGYDTTSVNASGTIKGDELIEVQFINERISSGSSSPTTGRTASSSGSSSSSSSSSSSTSNYPESDTDSNTGRNPSNENTGSEAETHEESNVKIESEDANVPKTGEYEAAACVILAAMVIGYALIFKRRKGNI